MHYNNRRFTYLTIYSTCLLVFIADMENIVQMKNRPMILIGGWVTLFCITL